MRVRKNIFPRTLSDICSMTFILAIVPLIYWFELWIVFPELYGEDTPMYLLQFLFGNFLMLNIVGNFTYTVLCDTSTRQTIVPTSSADPRDGWRLCSVCEAMSPPRSWHCPTCNTCILKRDHHCIFTGCCIGHFNHRYFLMFVFYLFVATVYSFIHNHVFVWSRIEFEFPMSIIKLVFPLAIFIFQFDGSMDQFYLLLYIVTTVGMLYTGLLYFYHFRLVLKGWVANESEKGNRLYDLGWKANIREVLGDRWYLAWLIPYVSSELPHDGILWDTKHSWNENCDKNR